VSRQKTFLLPIVFFIAGLCSGTAQSPAQEPSPDSALLAKANAGDAVSQVQAGQASEANRDYKQASAWYRRAAEEGSISGAIHLAELYRDGGKGFPRDMTQAAAWYRKAADQGDPTAQGTLGMLYALGQGVPRNDVEAYYWLDLAAAVKSANQAQYAANRQNVGTRVTVEELVEIQDRVAQWKAAHPRAEPAN
jgi:TPR repeat protein